MLRKIKKSKIKWVITDDYIVAFNNLQATMYYVYDLTNRIPFEKMKKKILKSSPDEYNSWVDILDLASKYNLRGHNAKFRKEWTES